MADACHFLKPDDPRLQRASLQRRQRALLGVIANAPRGSAEHARALAEYGAIAGRLNVPPSTSETA